MKRVKIFMMNNPEYAGVFFFVIISVVIFFKSYLFPFLSDEKLSSTLANIGVLADIAIAICLIGLTAKIGFGQIQAQRDATRANERFAEMQIEIQKNAQRISLFEKYSEIYCAYKDDMTNLDFYEQAFLLSPQQFEPNEYLNSKVIKLLDTSKLLLTEKECHAIGLIGTYMNELTHSLRFIVRNAKKQSIKFNVDWGQILFIENSSMLTNEQVSEYFYAAIRQYELANEHAINQIKDKKAKIKKIAENNNLDQVLENYCNINNILKN